MKHPLSPSDIEVLIHCHVSPAPHPRFHAPAVREALDMWERCGFIHCSRDGFEPVVTPTVYETTTKGKAMIEALCNVEEPRQVWVDHNGKPLLDTYTQGN